MPSSSNRFSISTASARRLMLVLMSVSTIYQYMYSTMLSSALGMLPLFGAAMFMSAQVATTLSHISFGDGSKYLTKRMRIAFMIISGIMLLCTLALLFIYPGLLITRSVWIIFAVIFSAAFRVINGRKLTARRMRRTIGKRAYFIFMAMIYLIPLLIISYLLFISVDTVSAWQLIGSFLFGAFLDGYTLWRERDFVAHEGIPDDIDPKTVSDIASELREVNAYSAYQRLHVLIMLALQLTLVLVYTFIGLTTQELFTCMILAVSCTVVMREMSILVLRRIKKPVALPLLLVGLFLWIYGLILFYEQMGQAQNLILSYLSLGLSVSGLSICTTALAELERSMSDVAHFTLQNRMHGYSQMRAALTEMAMLMGQMIALILLTLMCIPVNVLESLDLARIAASLSPLLIVPPLLLLLGAVFSALRFPMNNRHFEKLAKWLTLESEGLDNPALKKQLDSVVVKRHKNRFGIKIIIWLLRPLYYHKVIGTENLAPYEDGNMILVCNHGEIYGPVAANLYIPITFRPWTISHMMDEEAIIEHMYQGTMLRQKWIPEKWKRPIIKLFTPIMVWLFSSLEAIPVYRGQPHELMKTFRMTIDAMQAGDNILIFPENGEDHAEGERGYVSEGVGDLYTGFTMIAPLYYAKTKKKAVFVPIYASKSQRTLTIGEAIPYDPANGANDEKLRLSRELLSSMQAMYEQEKESDAKAAAKGATFT
ncbi:MAG: hypothetical protein GX096_03445 [Clostridiales bacterium]|nr:hypothetical protein [Clostridiales bacterium]